MAVTVTYTRADVTGRSDFQTNAFINFDQLSPDVLGMSNGGFVSAYNNININGGSIWLNFYDASFNGNGGLVAASGNDPTEAVGQPSLTQLANGNVLVVWDDDNTTDPGLRGHLFSQTGTPIGSELSLASSGALSEDPQVVALAGGGFVVSCTFLDNVFSSRFDNTGTQIDGYGVVNTVATAGAQNDSAIAALADGGYVITYTDAANSGDFNIRGAIYNADGSPRATDFGIDTDVRNQTQAKVVGLSSGNFAVVYTDASWNEGGALGNGITLKIVSPTGTSNIGAFHVNTTSAVDETDPDITVLANGLILVTWTHPTASNNGDIYGRVFDQSGHAVAINGNSTEFVVTNSTTDDILSAVSHLTGGKFITSWQDSETDTSGGSIHSTVSEITRTAVGDSANDVFVGDQLRDTFTGGAGNDTFVYKPGGNADSWIDFAAGAGVVDRIDLTAFINIHNLAGVLAHATAADSGFSTLLNFGNGDSLALGGVPKALLGADDFILNPFKDFNGDGFGDILFRNNSTGDTGYTDLHNNVFHSLGGSPVTYSVVGSGDYNGDSFSDILFRNNSTGDTGYTDIHNNVFHSLGGSPVAYSVVGSGDYNDDGFSDILFRNNSTGDTGYTDLHNNVFHSLGGSPAAYSVVGSGDYNGDNFSDILFRNNSTGDTGYTDLHNNVFHSLGGSPAAYSVVGSGDYNGDGFSDILFRNNSTGDTGYTDIHNNVFHSLGGSPVAWSVVASGDYNGDSFSDILFRNDSTGDTGYTDIHNNVFHSLGGSPAAYLVVA
jgi:hypothetical protein